MNIFNTQKIRIMKKSVLLVAFLAMLGVATAVAQPRAIGGQIGYGIEASYEHTLGNNFLSIDLGLPGWFYQGLGIEGVVTYNWLNPFGADFPAVSQGDWNWYMGVGLGIGDRIWNYSTWSTYAREYRNNFHVGVAGRFGVEYNFWFPLQLSAEWRPTVGPRFYSDVYYDNNGSRYVADKGVYYYTDGLYLGAILIGVRYKF